MLSHRLEFSVALGTIGNAEPFGHRTRAASRGRLMDDEDITTLDDPDFFAERRRVRELIEHQPPQAVSAELTRRMQQLNDELDKRARQAWSAWR
jgi:hypothetical protein